MKYKNKTEYFKKNGRGWLDRSEDTARLVVVCYEYMVQKKLLTSKNIDSLIQLTWITKGKKPNGEIDFDKCLTTVKLPALQQIFNTEEEDLDKMVKIIAEKTGKTERSLHHIVTTPTGIVNLRNTYRGNVSGWVVDNRQQLLKILRDTHSNNSANGAKDIANRVSKLPGVEITGSALHAMTLLSPLLACLAPYNKFPIINANSWVKAMLRELHMPATSAADRFDEFTNLFIRIPCNGLELDQMGPDVFDLLTYKPLAAKKTKKESVLSVAKPRGLSLKDASDINDISSSNKTGMKRIHNSMTNALKKLTDGKFTVREGTGNVAKFDALIEDYARGRDLLVEVKSSWDTGVVRLAVGQLYDYHRHLPSRHKIDMAALFPSRPSKHAFDLLEGLGIKVLWFKTAAYKSIVSNDRSFSL
ncbi:hypothetical protein PDESU_06172 [Pontiella desulfatans]|uniref:Uncharacterized protein n=1 Tax=Pontiella desulfatans TaxID=2750659 RepID=A0A6C2UDX8_PONDE|nr:hypothetical protein [Pontiella desulfatans]VGO17574.1 hypothetical protein PDESU_06172 [Pontiella desulfatans]